MIEDIEKLILLIKSGNISKEEIEHIIVSVKNNIEIDTSKGKESGIILRQIHDAVKFKQLVSGVNWVQVNNGSIGIGHKPGGKISFESLKKEGTSVLVTLLNENEGAATIGLQANGLQIDWVWFPFSASKKHLEANSAEVFTLYEKLANYLEHNARIYIHCSAGIHRTGMIAYGLLRYLGKDKAEAVDMLRSLRAVTLLQVGDERLLWGDQFYKPIQKNT